VKLCLAAGKIARRTDRPALQALFTVNGWELFDDAWVADHLARTAGCGYENDVAFVVAKILQRGNSEE
jgi:hypothetical protein